MACRWRWNDSLPDLANALSKYTASGSACLSMCMFQAFVSTWARSFALAEVRCGGGKEPGLSTARQGTPSARRNQSDRANQVANRMPCGEERSVSFKIRSGPLAGQRGGNVYLPREEKAVMYLNCGCEMPDLNESLLNNC